MTSNLDLVPGQVLRLKLISNRGDRWVFQVIPDRVSPPTPALAPPPLLAAFLAQGLPVLEERMGAWTRWLTDPRHPTDKEAWAASMEARGIRPGPEADEITPWLAWQAALEQGRSEPPPNDTGFWDRWNLRKTAGDPWLVMPLHWEYHGQTDAGLLQAHWDPPRQSIDRWILTAAPAGIPFRLEARCQTDRLHLVWRFFRAEDERYWAAWLKTGTETQLSQEGLIVSLEVQGALSSENIAAKRGVDIEA